MSSRQDVLLITEENVRSVFEQNRARAIEVVEQALLRRKADDVQMPDKICQIFDEEKQNRINCLPATLISDKVCGVKWVSVFPENPLSGLQNVSGMIILSEIEHGFTQALMDGAYLTGIRTAAVGAVAAKYLAKEDAQTIGFIGAGKEARRHFEMIRLARPSLKKCYVSSRRGSTVAAFIEEEASLHPDVEFVNCGDSFEAAARDADIIVTATSTQAALLKADWVKPGALYIHVGGWEDEFAVAQKADKIVCDEWECIKHRTQTLSRMYKAGVLKDNDIYTNLPELVAGDVPGRENDEEFIYFCSVGLAYIDVMFAKYVYDWCRQNGTGTYFAF